MADAWPTPHQRNYVPSTANGPIPADQWQNATQPDVNGVIQNCPCPICSRTRSADDPMSAGTIENQDLRFPVVRTESVDPYASQNVGGAHPAGIAATVGHPTQAWSVAPQAQHYQENAGYAPLHEICQHPSVFGALLGATSATQIQLLMEFTWNLVPLVDSKLSSR
ncbi:hypothetical protein V8E52_009306 [Russula decolorans]